MAKRFVRRVLFASLVLFVISAVAGPVLALGHSVSGCREWRSGAAKMAEMWGTFRLDAGERISFVHVEQLDSNYRVLSSGAGVFDTRLQTWRAASGDFRTVYYRVAFYIRNANGSGLRVVTGAAYRWTGTAR